MHEKEANQLLDQFFLSHAFLHENVAMEIFRSNEKQQRRNKKQIIHLSLIFRSLTAFTYFVMVRRFRA